MSIYHREDGRWEARFIKGKRCLCMGVSFKEICSIKYSDFNLNERTLTINHSKSEYENLSTSMVDINNRTIPITKLLFEAVNLIDIVSNGKDNYIITNSNSPIDNVKNQFINLIRICLYMDLRE